MVLVTITSASSLIRVKHAWPSPRDSLTPSQVCPHVLHCLRTWRCMEAHLAFPVLAVIRYLRNGQHTTTDWPACYSAQPAITSFILIATPIINRGVMAISCVMVPSVKLLLLLMLVIPSSMKRDCMYLCTYRLAPASSSMSVHAHASIQSKSKVTESNFLRGILFISPMVPPSAVLNVYHSDLLTWWYERGCRR